MVAHYSTVFKIPYISIYLSFIYHHIILHIYIYILIHIYLLSQYGRVPYYQVFVSSLFIHHISHTYHIFSYYSYIFLMHTYSYYFIYIHNLSMVVYHITIFHTISYSHSYSIFFIHITYSHITHTYSFYIHIYNSVWSCTISPYFILYHDLIHNSIFHVSYCHVSYTYFQHGSHSCLISYLSYISHSYVINHIYFNGKVFVPCSQIAPIQSSHFQHHTFIRNTFSHFLFIQYTVGICRVKISHCSTLPILLSTKEGFYL